METFETRTFRTYMTYWALATLAILFSNYFGYYINVVVMVFFGLMAFMVFENRIAGICLTVWAMAAASAFRHAYFSSL